MTCNISAINESEEEGEGGGGGNFLMEIYVGVPNTEHNTEVPAY